jgi:hypothetical protein
MHGIQAKLSGQKRKSGDVPIPSFSCVSPAAEKSEMPCWNQWSLTQAEAALAVSRIRRGPSKWSSEGLLQFDDFYSLVRQLSLVEPPKTEDPDGLSSPERLLYDLVSLGSPLLYQICQNEKNQWCLKLVDYQGNRVAALRQLMLDTPKLNAVAANKRNVILNAILEHQRASKAKKSVNGENSGNNVKNLPKKKILEPFILEGMSLEDRVQARAGARQEREAEAAFKKKSGKPDYSSLLRLADAMWSHSRHFQKRQFLKNTEKSTHVRPFSITVKQVVQLFSASLVSFSCSKTAQLHREKATRKEMLQALVDLQKLVPEWISFSSANLTKDTIVKLSCKADFTLVRTKLGAPKNLKQKSLQKVPARVSLSPNFSQANKMKNADMTPANVVRSRRAAPDALVSSQKKVKA